MRQITRTSVLLLLTPSSTVGVASQLNLNTSVVSHGSVPHPSPTFTTPQSPYCPPCFTDSECLSCLWPYVLFLLPCYSVCLEYSFSTPQIFRCWAHSSGHLLREVILAILIKWLSPFSLSHHPILFPQRKTHLCW
jgi:hypothetical protein